MQTTKTPVNGKPRRRTSPGPWLLGVLIVVILAAIAIPLYLGYAKMIGGSASQTAQQFAASTPGAHVTLALEVTSTPSQTLLTGNLLQKNADGTYSRTGKTVRVQWTAKSMVMGSSSQVKVGAILQASGVLSTDDILTASRVIILTGLVQLK